MKLFAVPLSIIQSKRFCKKVCFSSQFMSLSSSSSSSVVQSLDMAEENNTHCPDYVELKAQMQNLASSGRITKALEIFRVIRNVPGRPSVYDYNSLINCYLKSKNVASDDLFGLYVEMKRLGLYPNAITFNTLLKGLSVLGESKESLSVVMEMCGYGFKPSFSCLSSLLKKYLDSVDLVGALSVLDLMLRFNYIPTEPKVILLINSLSRHGMIRDAYFVFLKLLDKGYFHSAYIYNPILWALCKSNQIYGALAFFGLSKKKGLVHNVCSYTALVYGFSKVGLFWEAFHCLNIMEDDGCYPNVKTYTTTIKYLCDGGRVGEALGLLERMEKGGCDPDIVTYNVILRELCHQNMIFGISELFKTVDKKGLSPDPYTSTALSGLLKRGNIGIFSNLFLNVVSSNSDLDVAVYNVYIRSLCCARKSEESLSWVKRMVRNRISPNNVTYNTILKGVCDEKTADEALDFFDRIYWPEERPDLVSFNTILSHACKKGDSAMVQRVLDRMEHVGMKLNVVGFTCLLQYFCKVGKIHDCLMLFEHMIVYGPRPSIVTINTLMASLCKNRELGAAYGVFSNLRSYGLTPDSRTFSILVFAARNEGNNYLVNELTRELYSQGLMLHDNIT